MLRIVTNYTPRSHVLCGEALKDVYAAFRLEVLRVEEWSTWHPKMAPIPGGKGWCIRKANFDDLVTKLNARGIPFEIVEYTGPFPKKKQNNQKKQPKGYKNAYSFFAKDKWAEARSRLPFELQKDMGKISKEVAKMWKEVVTVSKDTQWHVKEKEAREEFDRVKTMVSSPLLFSGHQETVPEYKANFDNIALSAIPLASGDLVTPPDASIPSGTAPKKTYKEMWNECAHDAEVFFFGNVDEIAGEEYGLCRFIYNKEPHGKNQEYTLSFSLPRNSTEEELYKKAWELAGMPSVESTK